MAQAYGAWLDKAGITDRATVLIDAGGTVRHASSVGPGGERVIADLAALCEEVNAAHPAAAAAAQGAEALPAGSRLFIKSNCGASRAALLARANLHLEDAVALVNVSEDPAAHAELVSLAGKDQAPCLVLDGQPMLESADIIARMVRAAAPV